MLFFGIIKEKRKKVGGKMTIKLDEKIISRFREKVNENTAFRQNFKNIDGKNKWNIICSAMDWITVAVDGLPQIKLKHANGLGYNHLEALSLMQYILAVDILVESIIQLFRVIEGNKKPNYPFAYDNEIFKQSSVSDDIYFKHLRAVFGTHPVNLDSLDGKKQHNGEKFFASWTTQDFLTDNNFLVYLYSNDPNKDELYPLSISIDKINSYAEKRYKLLEILIIKVDQINHRHIELCKITPIPFAENPIEQLDILLEENKKRVGILYGYSNIIKYIRRLLKVDVTVIKNIDIRIIDEYKEYLTSHIPEIKKRLQEMNVKQYNFIWIYDYITGYEFEKVYAYLNDEEHPIGKQYFNLLIKSGVLPFFLYESNNFDLKHLILDAILHKESTKLKKRISFKELINNCKN